MWEKVGNLKNNLPATLFTAKAKKHRMHVGASNVSPMRHFGAGTLPAGG